MSSFPQVHKTAQELSVVCMTYTKYAVIYYKILNNVI
jgi:hypothetical protein